MIDPRIAMLANALSFTGVLIGIPSLAGSLLFGALALNSLRTPSTPSQPYPKNADAVILVILTIAKAIGGAANLLGKIGSGIIRGLAAASLSVLLFATLLYLTGQALDRHESWARWTAVVIMLPVALASLIAFLSRGRAPIRLAGLALASASGYALYLLWTVFGEPA